MYHRLFPELKSVTDPTSGYFVVNKRILEGADLNPQGFKILLEILVKTNWVKLEEIPYEFEKRLHGESKLDIKVAKEVLMHMYQLWRERRENRGSSNLIY